VDHGVAIFPTAGGIDPLRLGRLAEDRGFESLFIPEHTHIPVRRESPYPRGGDPPREYFEVLDPFVVLSAVAAVTERLRLGFGVCLVVERDPIITAKAVASLDQVSGGRVLFGVGAGWNLEEMRNHGTDPATRFALLRERVAAMRAIWTQEQAEFHGRFVDFEPIWCWPKPVQQPHPPVLVGGNGPGVLDRVLAWGDGWIPNARRDVGGLCARVAELQRRAGDAGRGPVPVTVYGAPRDRDAIARYARAGITRCVFWLPAGDAAAAEARLDEVARMVAPAG
jgi:probable F420-dependent oxidoreductase